MLAEFRKRTCARLQFKAHSTANHKAFKPQGLQSAQTPVLRRAHDQISKQNAHCEGVTLRVLKREKIGLTDTVKGYQYIIETAQGWRQPMGMTASKLTLLG